MLQRFNSVLLHDTLPVDLPETKFQREVPLFLQIREFPVNTVLDGWKEAPMPKPAPFIQPFL